MSGSKAEREKRPWLKWYDTARWKRRAQMQKQMFPLCTMCEAKGIVTAAEVADHVIKHDGDYQLFYYGALQSLCWPCHSKEKQQIEHRGYTTNVGTDGWPVDDKHPVNRAARASEGRSCE